MSRPPRSAVIDLEELVTFRISRLYSCLNTGVARQLSQRFGLVLREWRVLALLARHEPMSARELVRRSPLDKASVSRALTQLARRGLIETAPNPHDARVQTIRLSEEGWRLYAEVAPLSLARQRTLLEPLSAAERELFFRCLDKIEAAAADSFAEDGAGPRRRRARGEGDGGG